MMPLSLSGLMFMRNRVIWDGWWGLSLSSISQISLSIGSSQRLR